MKHTMKLCLLSHPSIEVQDTRVQEYKRTGVAVSGAALPEPASDEHEYESHAPVNIPLGRRSRLTR
jgi:hypothetical protein